MSDFPLKKELIQKNKKQKKDEDFTHGAVRAGKSEMCAALPQAGDPRKSRCCGLPV